MTDYETAFPDDFPAALKHFAAHLNDGKVYGARQRAAEELRTPDATLKGWLDGRPCRHEALVRRAMTLIANQAASALSTAVHP